MVTLLENPLRVGLQQERTRTPNSSHLWCLRGSDPAQAGPSALQNEAGDAFRQKPLLWEWHVEIGAMTTSANTGGIEQFSDGIGPQDLWQLAQGLFYCSGDIDNPESYQN